MTQDISKIEELVLRFDRNLDAYRSGQYNETQVRREFVDPFFIHVCNKSFSDFLALCGFDGNVLKVWFGTAEPSGRGDCLVKRCVNAAGFRVDEPRQRIGIGGFKF